MQPGSHHHSGYMSRRFRSAISALAILVYAVVAVGAVHAESLCLGSDGHIAFEGPAGGDDCHDNAVTLDSPVSSDQAIGVEGPDCVDFALPGRTVLKAQESQVGKVCQFRVAWFLFENAPTDATFPARIPSNDCRAMSARTLTSHRTALLLI